MSAQDRLLRTGAGLTAGLIAVAALSAIAVATAVLAGVAGADGLFGLPLIVRQASRALAAIVGLGVAGRVLARGRRVRSLATIALWVEERRPALRYALVTAVDPRYAGRLPSLERAVAPVSWSAEVRRATVRALQIPALVLGLALLAIATAPRSAVERSLYPRPGDILLRGGRAARANRVEAFVVTVSPPAYTGLGARVYEQPVGIPVIEGSSVRVNGVGGPAGVVARLGDLVVPVEGAVDSWMALFVAPDRPVALRLSDGDAERVVAIEGRPDSLPLVTLVSPARDTVYRAAPDTLRLAAEARDDFGVAELWFEYIVSSGQGESFRFRSGLVGRRNVAGRAGTQAATLRLESLAVGPGDVVHLRAVARDNRTDARRGLGVSDTRTLRVTRRDEYDSVSVEAMGPTEADTSALSQRMLIMLADALELRRPRLGREVVVGESRGIARDQAQLRRRVARVVFMRLGGEQAAEEAEGLLADSSAPLTPEALLAAAEAATGRGAEATDFREDETPVVAVNRPLLEAYNAMWDATSELEVGQPGRAVPYMRAALDAIQRARAAERIYLRGRPPAVVVDLSRVRLAGRRDDAGDGGRTVAVMDQRTALVLRFRHVLSMVAAGDPGAADTLVLMRLDALEHAPFVGDGLARAAAAVRAGKDAVPALGAVRAALAGPMRTGPLRPWSVVP